MMPALSASASRLVIGRKMGSAEYSATWPGAGSSGCNKVRSAREWKLVSLDCHQRTWQIMLSDTFAFCYNLLTQITHPVCHRLLHKYFLYHQINTKLVSRSTTVIYIPQTNFYGAIGKVELYSVVRIDHHGFKPWAEWTLSWTASLILSLSNSLLCLLNMNKYPCCVLSSGRLRSDTVISTHTTPCRDLEAPVSSA